MKSLSREMRVMGFMAEKTKKWRAIRDWFKRASAGIQVFLLLRARDWPELDEPRKGQELCHDRSHPWTDAHSWYAVMGGFAFEDTAAEELQFMPGGRSRFLSITQLLSGWRGTELSCYRTSPNNISWTRVSPVGWESS